MKKVRDLLGKQWILTFDANILDFFFITPYNAGEN